MGTSTIPLILGHDVKRAEYRDALPINMVPVIKPIADSNGYLTTHPGLVLFGTGFGADRAGVYNERWGRQYRISGTRFIEVGDNGSTTILGNVPGTSQCSMKEFASFNTQGVIADGKMFLFDPSTGLLEITDPDLGTPIDGIWINGYYFLTDGEYLYHTDIDDETSIDPLKYASAEFMPDATKGLSKTIDNKVAVWGRYSLEYFTDIAQENFAFTRIESRAQKIGIVATHAKCEVAGSFYIVGSRKDEAIAIHKVGLGSTEKISTAVIDKLIKEYTEDELQDIRVESRVQDNINYVMFHFPDYTFCFNVNFALAFGVSYAWSILESDITGSTPYRGINGVYDPRVAKWIFGDKYETHIGYLSDNTAKHYDEIVEWVLYTPFIFLETLSIDELSLETVPGYNLADDAKIALSSTFDGQSYSMEHWFTTGAPLDYTKRFILYQLGYVEHFIGFKFRGISESKMTLANMRIIYS